MDVDVDAADAEMRWVCMQEVLKVFAIKSTLMLANRARLQKTRQARIQVIEVLSVALCNP
ncbi:hypothetical protein [Xanthomonas graminis]|uniref:hypothetical protein n=1 Tax=Xanthomonas graminis TaxID=3390026 RepID=UPI00118762C7|nr:hypothetical protein [Xanthomonas translucens]UKE66488.1 hypothetical protein KM547_04090 [Xanthomonas translucens pv. phlei]